MNYFVKLFSSFKNLFNTKTEFLMLLFLGFMMVTTDLFIAADVSVYQWIIFSYALLIVLTKPFNKNPVHTPIKNSIFPAIITFFVTLIVLIFLPVSVVGSDYPRPEFVGYFSVFAWYIGVIGFSETLIFQRNIGGYNKVLGIITFALFHVGTMLYFNNFSYTNLGIIALSGLAFQFIYDKANQLKTSGLLLTSIIHGLIDAFKYGFLTVFVAGGLT